jgi:multiple sugar transport system permease protein
VSSTAPTAPRSRNRFRGQQRENRDAWILVSPTAIIVIAVIVVPILWNVILAFQDKSFTSIAAEGIFGGELTMDNFLAVVTGAGFWRSLWTTRSCPPWAPSSSASSRPSPSGPRSAAGVRCAR